MRARALAAALAVMLGAVVVAAPVDAATTTCTENPFTARFDAALRARWPGHRISATVYDTRTGCTYGYRTDLRLTTASVLKAAIMGAVLLRAQDAGRALTATEVSLIGPMIRTSDDPSANALWTSVGGVAGMRAFDLRLGLTETVEAAPWGLTSTSSLDRVRLLRQMVLGEYGPFTAATRAVARSFLLDVAPSQRWGITAGVPDTWKVPLKNGFYPAGCCGWRVNTAGVVERPGGGAYVGTVLSDGWPSLAAGIPAVEYVARTIAAWTLGAVGPHVSPARYVSQLHLDILGRGPSQAELLDHAGRLGVDARRAVGSAAALLADPQVDRTSSALLRLYLAALGRLPDATTWSARVAQLRAGTRSLTWIGDGLAASAEFTGGVDLTTPAFVDRAFQQALGRSPTAAERASWVTLLDAGAGRGLLLAHLAESGTVRFWRGRTVQVAQAYLMLWRRLPGTASAAAWEQRLWDGAPLTDLIGVLLASPTYAARFPASAG